MMPGRTGRQRSRSWIGAFEYQKGVPYHWQAADGSMIARWDNAAHWPSIPTFPHHVHRGGDELPAASDIRSVADALSLIEKTICC